MNMPFLPVVLSPWIVVVTAPALTEILDQHPLVTIERREQMDLPDVDAVTVLATGPLTSESLANDLRGFTGRDDCHFFDAASPIVHGDSIDLKFGFPSKSLRQRRRGLHQLPDG
jgi:folate-dependent tRNA-U54 methylase TrmFO/GidA